MWNIKQILAVITLSITASAYASFEPDIKPFTPFRISDNLFFIGNTFDASYLVTTSSGNIIINSGDQHHLSMLKESIKKLGFNYADTKIILISHSHIDHCGAAALIKQETGAQYMVMKQDVSSVESGGKLDFAYGKDPSFYYPAAKVDRVLHDGEKVQLGKSVLTAHLNGGHTKGNTTWSLPVTDHGKTYRAVITGSTSVNPGYVLVNNKEYPSIIKDYQHTFKSLKGLPCDIFLGAHPGFFNYKQKVTLIGDNKKNPFIDPSGYREFVNKQEINFQTELAKAELANKAG